MKKKKKFFSLSFSLSLRLSPSPNKSLPHPTQTLKLNQGPSYNGLKTPHALGALTDRSQGTRFLLLFPPVFPPFLSRSLPLFILSPTNNINNKHLPKTTQSKRRTSRNGLKTPHALGALTDRSLGTRLLFLPHYLRLSPSVTLQKLLRV